MAFKIVLCIMLVGAAFGLCLRSGIDWQRDRGKSLGERYMRDFGFAQDEKDK